MVATALKRTQPLEDQYSAQHPHWRPALQSPLGSCGHWFHWGGGLMLPASKTSMHFIITPILLFYFDVWSMTIFRPHGCCKEEPGGSAVKAFHWCSIRYRKVFGDVGCTSLLPSVNMYRQVLHISTMLSKLYKNIFIIKCRSPTQFKNNMFMFIFFT